MKTYKTGEEKLRGTNFQNYDKRNLIEKAVKLQAQWHSCSEVYERLLMTFSLQCKFNISLNDECRQETTVVLANLWLGHSISYQRRSNNSPQTYSFKITIYLLMISLAIWAQLNLDISSLLHVAGAGFPHMSGASARIAGPLPLVGCYPQGASPRLIHMATVFQEGKNGTQQCRIDPTGSDWPSEEIDSTLDRKSCKEFVSILIYTINKSSHGFGYQVLAVLWSHNIQFISNSKLSSYKSHL